MSSTQTVGAADAVTSRRAWDAVPALGYQPALDGVRALAIVVVVLFHARAFGFHDGRIGVDVFFVLSGFLITTLLVEEVGRTGGLSFKDFYVRRAARLLPALAVVAVAVVPVALALHAPDTIRGVATSAFYVSNWSAIVWPTAGLGLLLHTWTLAIEEQFYLVWPVVLLVLAHRLRTLRAFAWAVAVLVALFAVEVAVLVAGGASSSRVDYGTDTRAPMLLAGALLAVVLARRRQRGAAPLQGSAVQVAGLVGIAVIVATSVWVPRSDAVGFGIQWPLTTAATAAVLVAVVAPSGASRRLLSFAPLVLVGKFSYGLYLWNFPVFYVLDVWFGLDGHPAVGAVGVALSFAVAYASFRWLEAPARRTITSRWAARRSTRSGAAPAELVAIAP